RLSVQIDVHPFHHLELHPGQARAYRDRVDATQSASQHRPQRPYRVCGCRHDAQIEQTVIDTGRWAEHLAAAGLTTIADTECEELALPVELRSAKASGNRMHLAQAREPGDQVGRATEHLLQVFRGVCGDAGT